MVQRESTQLRGHLQADSSLLTLVAGRRPSIYYVRLNLPFHPLFIGEIRTGSDGTYSKRVDPAKHVHHDSQSIAVSAALLTAAHIPFRWIVCDVVGQGKLVTTRRYMLAHGESFRYRNYEPQIALPVSEWGKERALGWEAEEDRRERIQKEIAAQGSLFEAVA